MKQKKNIDRLFEERFKNFESSPSPQVWKNIQAQLEKEKEDRKVIPLWWKLGGVAALLALLLTVGNSVFDFSSTSADKSEKPTLTQEDKVQTKEGQKDGNSILKENSDIEVASEEKTLEINESSSKENDLKSNPASEGNVTKKRSENAVATETSSKKERSKFQSNSNTNLKENIAVSEKDAVAANQNSKNKKSADKNIIENIGISDKDAVAVQKTEKDIQKKADAKNESLIKKELGISETVKTDVAVTDSSEKKNETKTEDSSNKKSILDAIEEEKTKDAVAKKTPPENRWVVSPNVAPVYYSSLGSGSSIDPTFADNSQSGDVNWSYGVQLSYALSNRLSVRTGVSNLDLSYSTSGIEIGEGPVALALRSVNYGNSPIVLTAVDKGTFASQNTNGGYGNITPKSTQGNAEIVQRINYYEVPLELKYALFNNKLGVNLIGGLSTLFLGNNEIAVRDTGFESVLGEANNLSNVSFSTNVGLGLDYKISKKFVFNIEPMFKYQLNPYTDSSVGFKPYYLGVYSGFSFKF